MARPDITAYVHGNASDFHAAMRRVRGDASNTARHTRTAFTALASFGRGLIGGLVAGGAVGAVSGLARIAGGIAQIGDEAKRAGLSVKDFQQLKFVAEQNRIDVDALVDGIKELNLRADEFIQTGGGGGAEAFQRLGYSAEELREKLRDPSALFTEIIGKLEKLDDAARIRIADEIFGGTGGEKFVQLVERGEKGIRDQIQAANDLGIVLDEDLIDRADELDRKFGAIASTVSTTLKSAIVEAAAALQDFIDRFRHVEARQTETLQSQLADAERNLKAAQDRQGSLGGFFDRAYEQQIEASQAEVERLRNVLRDRALQTIRPQLETLGAGGAAPKDERLGYTPPVKTKPRSGGGGRGASTDEAEREAEAVRRLIAELEEELQLIGASKAEKEIAATLRRANADAASAEGKQIASLITQINREEEALRQAEEAARFFGDATEDAFMAMLPTIQTGNAALDGFLNTLIKVVAQAALFGSGPLAGLFGGGGGSGLLGMLFGGFRAGGGDVSPGRLYRVNEYGDEYFTPSTHGKVLPAGAGAGGSSYAPVYNIDARGADAAAVARLEAGLKQRDRKFGAMVDRRVDNRHFRKTRA
jgi:hypothetical protein